MSIIKYQKVVPVKYVKVKKVVSRDYKKFGNEWIPTNCEIIEEYIPMKYELIEVTELVN